MNRSQRPFSPASLCLATLLWLLSLGAAAADFSASVDRTELAFGETLELRLSARGQNAQLEPDLAPLRDHFTLLNRMRSFERMLEGGQLQRRTLWRILLKPKRQGLVVIPPLTLGPLRSEPIRLRIGLSSRSKQAGQADTARIREPVFFTVELAQSELYEQQQALLTVRLFHSTALLKDSELGAPSAEGALIYSLGEPRQSEQVINGIRHGVFEVQYALFPQRSGTIEILPPAFLGSIAVDGSRGFGLFGKKMHLQPDPVRLEVKAKPADYPAGHTWLPAQRIELSEHWSQEPETLQLGESLTRTLTLKALGLSAAQLPSLSEPDLEGVRIYAEPAKSENLRHQGFLEGQISQSQAFVAVAPGRFELPPLRIAWFNTEHNRVEWSELPARTIEVIGSVAREPARTATPSGAEQSLFWPLFSALLGVLLLALTGYCLWLHQRLQQALQSPDVGQTRSVQARSKVELKKLQKHCKTQNFNAFSRDFCRWHRELTGIKQGGLLSRAHQLGQTTKLTELETLLMKLDRAQYGEHPPEDPTAPWQQLNTLLPQIAQRLQQKQRSGHREAEDYRLYPHENSA